jgi:glutaredoxin
VSKPIFTIISKENCAWCFRARQELAKNNYEFKAQQIGKDITLQEVRTCYPNQNMVPIILIQDGNDAPRRVLGSYNELMVFLKSGNGA